MLRRVFLHEDFANFVEVFQSQLAWPHAIHAHVCSGKYHGMVREFHMLNDSLREIVDVCQNYIQTSRRSGCYTGWGPNKISLLESETKLLEVGEVWVRIIQSVYIQVAQ